MFYIPPGSRSTLTQTINLRTATACVRVWWFLGQKDASQKGHSIILEHNYSISCATQFYPDIIIQSYIKRSHDKNFSSNPRSQRNRCSV